MFVPLHDDNALEQIPRPYVNWALVALSVAVHALVALVPSGDVGAASAALGIVPSAVQGPEPLQAGQGIVPPAGTLVTYAFLHGGWMHLLGNMLFLWVFGDNIEDAVGHGRYLLFFVLCAAGAGLFHVVMHPGSGTPLIGASGAVAGVVSAYLLLHPRVKVWVLVLKRLPMRLTAAWVLGFWVLFQLGSAVVDTGNRISWWAHVGGIVVGMVLIVFMRRRGVPLLD